jgi:soluble lytic murein transglycosylase
VLQKFRILFTAMLWGIILTSAVKAQSEEENGALLSAAIAQAEDSNWENAAILARRVSDPIAGEIITWMRLRKGKGDWSDYTAFLKRNPDWPGLKLLRHRGEGAMPGHHAPSAVFAYFKESPPQTGIGVIRLTEAYEAIGDSDAAKAEAIHAWLNFSMTRDERVTLNKRYEKTLAKYHVARLDMLLWRNLPKHAAGLYTLVPSGYEQLAKARLGLRKRVKGVNALISAVPPELLDDPGLSYERFEWRARKGLYDSARDLLVERSVSAKKLGRPEKWAGRRRSYARQEMRNGDNKRAYLIASKHFLSEGSDFADLEWLSGYIALRKLNDPAAALRHFQRFRAAIATPISNGRAGYWQGRAYEALGDKKNAKLAYQFGAQYQTSFYGQLAAEKIGASADASLAGREASPNWREAVFLGSTVFRAAILFHYADQSSSSERFLKHLAESQDRIGLQQLADIAMEIGRPNIAVRLSKQAARQGHVLPKTYFPVTALAKYVSKVKPEEAMSIARRESELDQFIISPAGARGLMQIMPGTAQKVANDIGVTYSKAKLTEDWKYNARLGSTYLAEQLEDFDGSFILAFAAYNAGPHRARTWIKTYGDPRKNSVDQIDWIEHIPFCETRNYVMRVVESLHVYRARIKGKTPKLRISTDLKKG